MQYRFRSTAISIIVSNFCTKDIICPLSHFLQFIKRKNNQQDGPACQKLPKKNIILLVQY